MNESLRPQERIRKKKEFLLIYKKFAESRRDKRGKFAPLIERALLQIEEDQGEDLDDDPDESWIEAKKRVTALITELDSKESVKG